MTANGRHGYRIVWSIAALVSFVAFGLAAIYRWEPLKRGLLEWARHASSAQNNATAAYEQRNWQQAAELARQLLKTKADDPDLLRVYARALSRLQRDRTAAAVYDRIDMARLEPEDYFLLGLAFTRTGKLDQALEIWNKGVKSGDAHAELLDHLARLSVRLQRLDEAAEAARKLERLPGWQARALLVLGEVQSLLKNPKGAVEAIQKALDLDPNPKGLPVGSDHFRKLLSRSLLELGAPNEAIKTLQTQPRQRGPAQADAEANWLLSRAYLQNGETTEALAAFARSGSYRQDNPLVPEPSPYVGGSRCASCHPGETRAHDRSRHARTFHRGPQLLDLPFPNKPLPDPDLPEVIHTFRRDPKRIQVDTQVGDRVFETIVEYAFGVRERYVTMIGRDIEKNYRALRLSSYHTTEGISWGATSGDVPDSDAVENVRGEPIPVRDGVVRCVYCHVTNFRDFRDPPPEDGVGPTAADAGIGCERCHGPGGNHLAAIKADFPDPAIVNAGTASSKSITTQCADCHVVGSARDIGAAPVIPKVMVR
jgi:tetratricopeptide (TPR) repeat protein